MTEPIGLHCPGCKQPPCMMIGDTTAFCGNEECNIISWNPTATREQLGASPHFIRMW